MIEIISWLIPLPPVLAFGLIVLFAYRSNRISHILGIGGMLIFVAGDAIPVIGSVPVKPLLVMATPGSKKAAVFRRPSVNF